MMTLKRWVVRTLEDLCVVEHWIFHHENWLSWLWFDYLDQDPCQLAMWSSELDERWGTGEWRKL